MNIQEVWGRFQNGKDTQKDIVFLFSYIDQLETLVKELETNLPEEIIIENENFRRRYLIDRMILGKVQSVLAEVKNLDIEKALRERVLESIENIGVILDETE